MLRPSILPELRFDVAHAGDGQLSIPQVDARNEEGRPPGAGEGLVAPLNGSGGIAPGMGGKIGRCGQCCGGSLRPVP